MPIASRTTWTGLLFIPTVTVEPSGVRYKRRIFLREDELFIPFAQISQVFVRSGLVFGDLVVHSTGQTEPNVTRLWRSHARTLASAIERRISQGRDPRFRLL